MTDFRIHPAIGVARVGNSDQFFIGPESPGVPANLDASGNLLPFKDSTGKVLRQAARFRIFEFDASGNPVREITLADSSKIEWRVHVANRKASFFSFNGQSGAEGPVPYVARDLKGASANEKLDFGDGQPARTNRRNAGVVDRRSLEIDPGVARISSPTSVVPLTDANTISPVKTLGELRMEDKTGRLIFLGGRGVTESLPNAPRIDEYASNDGWFDDMSDGSIHATVTLPDGTVVEARSAWVIGGPPKFAPEIRNVVSLYDLLWDLAVRNRLSVTPGTDSFLNDLVAQQNAWDDTTGSFRPGYQPSFMEHIYPILSRALAVRDVHADPRNGYHGQLAGWGKLADPTEDQIRQAVFGRIRDPNSKTLDYLNMPRGLGDDYTSLDDFESDRTPTPPKPTAFLTLTRVQYALLKTWATPTGPSGPSFKSDWTAGDDVMYAPRPPVEPDSPHRLDRAALENCVGGPFYPGIEVSWLIRQVALYVGAFRLRDPEQLFSLGPLPFEAGFFSQQMALPWQADFYDCHKEDHTTKGAKEPLLYMWWTAQRPDDIRLAVGAPLTRWVAAFDGNKDPSVTDPDDIANFARFEQMRTRWSELSFIVLDGDNFIAQK